MLRSLVGSEMCIRDRLQGSLAIAEVHLDHAALRRLTDASAQQLADYPYGCLLYTSDAADDLLCVDHGGRRILKKKKQHHNNVSNPQNTLHYSIRSHLTH